MTWQNDSYLNRRATLMKDNGVAYFNFDEPNGNVLDVLGNGYIGTVSNADRVSSPTGKAINFNGGQSVKFNNKIIPIGKKTIRMKLMIKATTVNANEFIISNGEWGYNGFSIDIGLGRLRAYYTYGASNVYYTTSAIPTLNVWHDIVFTFDGNTARLYVDDMNTPVSTALFYGTEPLPSGDLTLGKSSLTSGGYSRVMIDELEIYNKVITPKDFINRKYLVKSNNQYYYDNNGSWSSLGENVPTYKDFLTYGMDTVDNKINLVSSPYQIMGWTDTPLNQKFNLDGVKVEPFQLATLKSPIPIAWAERLKGVLTTVQGDNGIKVSLSFDNENWYGNGLSSIVLSRENVRNQGMTIGELNGYNSTQLEQLRGTSNVLYLSYFFPDETSKVTEIKILGDEWGKYTQVEPLNVNYTVSYINPETLQVNINKNFDAIKINY